MPIDANFIGGAAQGYQQQKQMQADFALRKAQSDLENKKLKMMEDEQELKKQTFQRQMDGLFELIKGSVAPSTPTAPTGSVAPSGLNPGTPQGPPTQVPFRPGVQPPGQAPAQTGQTLPQNTPQFTPEQLKNAQILASAGDYDGALKALITKPDTPSVGAEAERIHLAEYGVPYSKGTRESQQAVNKLIDTKDLRKLGEEKRVEAELKRNEPVPLGALRSFRHPDPTAPPLQFGVSRMEANKLGYAELKEKEIQQIGELRGIRDIVGQLEVAAKDLPLAKEGGLGVLVRGGKLTYDSWLGIDPNASFYAGTKQAVLGKLARGLGGEKGVLTDKDIARIAMWLPSYKDTTQVRDMKLRSINLLIDQAEKRNTDLIFGLPLSSEREWRKEIEGVFNELKKEGLIPADKMELDNALGPVKLQRQNEGKPFLVSPSTLGGAPQPLTGAEALELVKGRKQ